MSTGSITTSDPSLNLNDAALITKAGFPWPLPLNTTISCEVTAIGVGLDEESLSITQPTGTVTVVADTGQTGRFVSDITAIFNADGTLTASVETAGEYDRIEWQIGDNGGDPEPPTPIVFESFQVVKDKLAELFAENPRPLNAERVIDLEGKDYITIENTTDGVGLQSIDGVEGNEAKGRSLTADPLGESSDITFINGNFYVGFTPNFVEASDPILGNDIYAANWDFTINGQENNPTAPWLWSPDDIPPKTIVFPEVTTDREHPSQVGEIKAYDDYGYGRVSRYSVVESDGVQDGYEYTEGGSTIKIPAEVRDEINAYFGITGFYDQSFFLNIQHSDNRAAIIRMDSYDSVNGVFTINADDTDTIVLSPYLRIGLMGIKKEMRPGQIFLSPAEQKIYWKPREGKTPTGNEVFGLNKPDNPLFKLFYDTFGNAAPYFYPDRFEVDSSGETQLVRPGGSSLATFRNCNFVVGDGAYIDCDYALLKLDNCSFTYSSSCVGQPRCHITNCLFDHIITRSLSCAPGSVMEKTYWGRTYTNSNVNCSEAGSNSVGSAKQRPGGDGFWDVTEAGWVDGAPALPAPQSGTDTLQLLQSVFRDNFCFNPTSQHGQVISWYFKSFGNSITENNICYNLNGGFTISTPFGWEGAIQYDKMIVRNNLYITDDYCDNNALVEIQDILHDEVVNKEDFAVVIQNNSIFNDNGDIGSFKSTSVGRITTSNTQNKKHYFINNISGVVTANSFPGESKHPTISTHNFWDFQTGSQFKAVSSPNDLASPTPGDDYRNAECKYDIKTHQPLDNLLTGATDGESVGCRFDTIPTRQQLYQLRDREITDWWNVFQPSPVPEFTTEDLQSLFGDEENQAPVDVLNQIENCSNF